MCRAMLCAALGILELLHPAGIDFTHRNSPLIETMGGGVALLDDNNDGLLDPIRVRRAPQSRRWQRSRSRSEGIQPAGPTAGRS